MRIQLLYIVNLCIYVFLLTDPVDSSGIKTQIKFNITAFPISHLSSLLSPFSRCLIHLISYRYLDIPSTRIPLVLERYPSQKFLSNIKRRQNDNFRWICVFHGFVYPPMPQGSAPQRLFKYPAFYAEFWTGQVKRRERFSNILRHRDYYVYFTNTRSVRKWLQFVQGVQEGQGAGGMNSLITLGLNFLAILWHNLYD